MFVQIGKYWINLDNINYIEHTIEGSNVYNVIFNDGTQLEIGYWLNGDFAVENFLTEIKNYKTFDMRDIIKALVDIVIALENLKERGEENE